VGLAAAADLMRGLAVLGAVAALLAAYLLFFDRDSRNAAPDGQATRFLPAFDRGAVKRLIIERAGEPPFTLEHDGSRGWRIEPEGAAADQAAVDDLLGALDQAQSERTADVSPEAAGLSPPHVTVSIDDGGRSKHVRLGRSDASGRGVFMQDGGGGPVLVGPARLKQLADRPVAAFRDRRMVPFAPDLVTRVAWRASPDDREHSAERQGGQWRNSAGERLAPERVAEAIRQLVALQSGPDAGAPGDESGWIEVRAQSGASVRLSGGVPAPAWTELWRVLASADTADRRLLSTPPDRVRRVELDDGSRRLVLAREGGGAWKIEAPASVPAEQSLVSDWLARLAQTQATVPAAHGRRLVVDGATDDAVTVGPRDPAYAALDPDPLRFRARAVLDFAHFDLRELRRISASGTLDVTTRDGETWAGAAVDQAAVRGVVSALGNLRADAFLPHPPKGHPDLVLEVSIQPPGDPAPVRYSVQLWPGCDGQVDDASAFRIAPAACNELRVDPAKR
jgi:hypothetical protein